MLDAQNISLSYGKKIALHPMSLSLTPGTVTVLLGPNGAGKSSLLKVLAGAVAPTLGRVMIDGQDLAGVKLNQLSARRAVLSQLPSINFPFTARQIVEFGREGSAVVEGMSNEQIVETCLELLEVDHLQHRIMQTLSGGEQQRVHIARILAQIWQQRDGVLFLDEPTSALDLKHQFQVLDMIRDYCGRWNLAVCIILHDLRLARMVADEAVLLTRGAIQHIGPVKEVLEPSRIQQCYGLESRHMDLLLA